jgi:hypothetical protein
MQHQINRMKFAQALLSKDTLAELNEMLPGLSEEEE